LVAFGTITDNIPCGADAYPNIRAGGSNSRQRSADIFRQQALATIRSPHMKMNRHRTRLNHPLTFSRQLFRRNGQIQMFG
jgi:hypothetical protein